MSSSRRFSDWIHETKTNKQLDEFVDLQIKSTGLETMDALALVLTKTVDIMFNITQRGVSQIYWHKQGVYTLKVLYENEKSAYILLYLPGDSGKSGMIHMITDETKHASEVICPSVWGENWVYDVILNRMAYLGKPGTRKDQFNFALFDIDNATSEKLEETGHGDFMDYIARDTPDNPLVNTFVHLVSGVLLDICDSTSPTKPMSTRVDFDEYTQWEFFWRKRLLGSTNEIKNAAWTRLNEDDERVDIWHTSIPHLGYNIEVQTDRAKRPMGTVKGFAYMNQPWSCKPSHPIELFPLNLRSKLLTMSSGLGQYDRFVFAASSNSFTSQYCVVNIASGQVKTFCANNAIAAYDQESLWICKPSDTAKIRQFLAPNATHPPSNTVSSSQTNTILQDLNITAPSTPTDVSLSSSMDI